MPLDDPRRSRYHTMSGQGERADRSERRPELRVRSRLRRIGGERAPWVSRSTAPRRARHSAPAMDGSALGFHGGKLAEGEEGILVRGFMSHLSEASCDLVILSHFFLQNRPPLLRNLLRAHPNSMPVSAPGGSPSRDTSKGTDSPSGPGPTTRWRSRARKRYVVLPSRASSRATSCFRPAGSENPGWWHPPRTPR